MQNLKKVYERFSLQHLQISPISDDSSENKGAVLLFLSNPDIIIEKLIAQKHIRPSSRKIEAMNKRLK